MRSFFAVLLAGLVLIAGCRPGAPTPRVPTDPPIRPTPPSAISTAAASAVASATASPSVAPVLNAPLLASGPPSPGFVLQSSAFSDGGNLPSQYSCDGPGGGQSPPLSWSGAPAGTRAFALVDQDPDAGSGGAAFTHWVLFNIPATLARLEPGLPVQNLLTSGALQGQNGRRLNGYQGACPPAGSPPHHYTFQLFALDGALPLQAGASIVDVQRAMDGHIVGQTQLVALFGH